MYRTQWMVMGLAGLHIFVSLRGTAENFFLLTHAEAEAWPFLLGHATDTTILTLPNWTVSGSSCH